MKLKSLLLFLSLLMISSSLLAGDRYPFGQSKRNAWSIGANFAPMFLGEFSMTTYFHWGPNFAVGFNAGRIIAGIEGDFDPVKGDMDQNYVFGYLVAPEFRFYLNPISENNRYFVGVYGKYVDNWTSEDTFYVDPFTETGAYDLRKKIGSAGFTVGYSHESRKGWYVEPWIGVGRVVSTERSLIRSDNASGDVWGTPNRDIRNEYDAMDYRLGFSFGYRFKV